MPTDRVHRLPQQAQPRAIRPHRPQPSTSDAVTQLRHARPAPNERRYTRYVAIHPIRRGAMPTDRVHRLPQQAQPRAIRPHTPKRLHQTQPHNLEIPARLLTRRATPVTSRCTRYVAAHPLRRAAPVTSRCTQSEGVQCLRIGCTASHNKPNRGQFVPTDPNRPPRTLQHSFDMLARLRTRGATPVTSRYTRYVAKHPLRRAAPDQKGCNAYGSGAPPLNNKPN